MFISRSACPLTDHTFVCSGSNVLENALLLSLCACCFAVRTASSLREFNFIIHSKAVFVSGSQKTGFFSLITICGNPYIINSACYLEQIYFQDSIIHLQIIPSCIFPSPFFSLSLMLVMLITNKLFFTATGGPYSKLNYPKHLHWISFSRSQLFWFYKFI